MVQQSESDRLSAGKSARQAGVNKSQNFSGMRMGSFMNSGSSRSLREKKIPDQNQGATKIENQNQAGTQAQRITRKNREKINGRQYGSSRTLGSLVGVNSSRRLRRAGNPDLSSTIGRNKSQKSEASTVSDVTDVSDNRSVKSQRSLGSFSMLSLRGSRKPGKNGEKKRQDEWGEGPKVRKNSARAMLMNAMHRTRNERKKFKYRRVPTRPDNMNNLPFLGQLMTDPVNLKHVDAPIEKLGSYEGNNYSKVYVRESVNAKGVTQSDDRSSTHSTSIVYVRTKSEGKLVKANSTFGSAGSNATFGSAESVRSLRASDKIKNKGTVNWRTDATHKKSVALRKLSAESDGSTGSGMFGDLFKFEETPLPPMPVNEKPNKSLVNPKTLYKIKALLGTGTFGEVRKCVEKETGLEQAVKICSVATYEDLFELNEEVEMLKELVDCPYTAKYLKSIQTPFRELWITMELCECGDVSAMMELCGLTLMEDQIKPVIASALLALEYLHDKKSIVHRDVKGANLLFTFSGLTKMSDFGVSRKFEPGLRRMSLVGSPYWMPPEIVLEKPYDFHADIWALGITVIELADGNPPFIDLEQMEVVERIKVNPAQGLQDSSMGPEWFSPELNNFISRCLVTDPTLRPSAKELLEDDYIRDSVGHMRYLESLGLLNMENFSVLNSRNFAQESQDDDAITAYNGSVRPIQEFIDENYHKVEEDRKKHMNVGKKWARRYK